MLEDIKKSFYNFTPKHSDFLFESIGEEELRSWKTKNLRFLSSEKFYPPEREIENTHDDDYEKENQIKIVFTNGVLTLCQLGEFKDQIEIVEEKEKFHLLEKERHYFQTQVTLADLMNQTYCQKAYEIHIKEGTCIPEPLVIINQNFGSKNKATAHITRYNFFVGKNSQVSIKEVLVENEKTIQNKKLINHHGNFYLEKDSSCSFQTINLIKNNRFSVTTNHFFLEKGASLSGLNLITGGKYNRQESKVFHKGEHSSAELDGLFLAKDEENLQIISNIYHKAKKTNSHQLCKGLAKGRSNISFVGNIKVYQDASLTDANLLNKNLLLSDTAQVSSEPNLRIDHDDVKCHHGATVSQIREEELTYLQTRGLRKQDAEKILSLAFACELLEKHRCKGIIRNTISQFFTDQK